MQALVPLSVTLRSVQEAGQLVTISLPKCGAALPQTWGSVAGPGEPRDRAAVDWMREAVRGRGGHPQYAVGVPLIKQPPMCRLQPKPRRMVYCCGGLGGVGGRIPGKTGPTGASQLRAPRKDSAEDWGCGSDLGQGGVGKSLRMAGQPNGVSSPALGREGGWREAGCRPQWTTRSGRPRGPVGDAGSCWPGPPILVSFSSQTWRPLREG